MTVGSSYDIYSYTICYIVSRYNYRRSFVPLNSVDDCVIFLSRLWERNQCKENPSAELEEKSFPLKIVFFKVFYMYSIYGLRGKEALLESSVVSQWWCLCIVFITLKLSYQYSTMSKNYNTVLNEDIFKKLLLKCKYRIHKISNYGKVSKRKWKFKNECENLNSILWKLTTQKIFSSPLYNIFLKLWIHSSDSSSYLKPSLEI